MHAECEKMYLNWNITTTALVDIVTSQPNHKPLLRLLHQPMGDYSSDNLASLDSIAHPDSIEWVGIIAICIAFSNHIMRVECYKLQDKQAYLEVIYAGWSVACFTMGVSSGRFMNTKKNAIMCITNPSKMIMSFPCLFVLYPNIPNRSPPE